MYIPEQRPDIIASTEKRKSRPSTAQKKDIESLISNNLMKLRSLSPASKAAEKTKDGSNLTYDRLDVAKSVLVELRGKHEVATARAKKRPPPPPPPPKPPSPKPRTRTKLQPQRPPAPKIDLIDVHYVDDNMTEPLYAKVKKDQQNIRPER